VIKNIATNDTINIHLFNVCTWDFDSWFDHENPIYHMDNEKISGGKHEFTLFFSNQHLEKLQDARGEQFRICFHWFWVAIEVLVHLLVYFYNKHQFQQGNMLQHEVNNNAILAHK